MKEPEKSCRTCFQSDGTQRESRNKTVTGTVQRQCRISGLFVIVSDGKHCCSSWTPRLSNEQIAAKANEAANRKISTIGRLS